jgi:hypothetical protein
MYKARRILLRNAFGVAGGRDLPLPSQREARRSSRALEVSKADVRTLRVNHFGRNVRLMGIEESGPQMQPFSAVL